MSRPASRSRKDDNHDAIVVEFKALFCSVAELDSCGLPGFPDLVVGCVGVDHLVDVKNPETYYGRSGLNANQRTFSEGWRGGPVETASTPDEVLALVKKWRRAG